MVLEVDAQRKEMTRFATLVPRVMSPGKTRKCCTDIKVTQKMSASKNKRDVFEMVLYVTEINTDKSRLML